MNYVRKVGDKQRRRYRVVDDKCIGRSCFAPGEYQHRGATMSGSRNTGDVSLCCLNNAYHGCPRNLDERYSDETRRANQAEGWRKA